MPNDRARGPKFHRYLIGLFTVLLALLCYWLLGFVLDDISTWPGPDYAELEARKLDPALTARDRALETQIEDTSRAISDLQARQSLLRESTSTAERTMNQLLEFQRLSLQKNVTPSAEEQKALAESQQLFLANQQKSQQLNEQIAGLSETERELRDQRRGVQQQLAKAREPIQHEFDALYRRHELRLAALKLGALLPLLLLAVWLFLKLRGGTYAPMVYAYGIAVLAKVLLVIHEHFPTRYFKYLLILGALAIVARVLVYLLRAVAHPQRPWLLKQYREAYEAFLCPVCSYPIRRGPLKFMSWTRRSIRKQTVPISGDGDEPYTCPACSTRLFEQCDQCGAMRHSLLPACQKCGQARPIEMGVTG